MYRREGRDGGWGQRNDGEESYLDMIILDDSRVIGPRN